jgi:hypothetical protein
VRGSLAHRYPGIYTGLALTGGTLTGRSRLLASSEEDWMLPPFIIEQIRRREEEQERKQYEQPQLELPISPSPPVPRPRREDSEEGQRGVIILEL